MDRWLIIAGICVIIGSLLALYFHEAVVAIMEGGTGLYLVLKGVGGHGKEPHA